MAGAGSYGELTKVELSVSCTKLLDLDRFSKSDPCCFLYRAARLSKGKTPEWELVGRTEMIKDNLDPKFSKTFLVDYYFEEIQHFRAVVYDIDDVHHLDNTSKHDLLGSAEFNIGEVVSAGKTFSRRLVSPKAKDCGWIHINGEEVQDSKYDVTFQLRATKLDKKDFFGKSDPFLEISKSQEGGSFTVVYRSDPIMKTLDPRWPRFTISIRTLCSSDWQRTLRFTVYDWNRSGTHELIGHSTCTLQDLTAESRVKDLSLIHPDIKAKKGKKYHNSGVLHFDSVTTTPTNSFIDYIKGGCNINLMVAVDFTGSNGKPCNPNSLHYNDPSRDNEYVSAIKSVASILADYDTDQMFPAFGFGARAPQFGGVSHCFPLNFNFDNPEVYGVQGILDAYRYTLSAVELYGPTNFSSILDRAAQYASAGGMNQSDQQYLILLIITDGIITDMDRSIDRIVKGSFLPMSVVIVGVGKADFSAMEVLDADDNPLVDSSGRKMARDIVQFVPLRQFSTAGASFSLARETLAEIPGQFMAYVKQKNIKPNPPVIRPLPTRGSVYQPQGQTAPYPGQPGSAPYPGQPGSAPYPGQPGNAPYPGQPGSAPYPGQPGSAPYPGQPGNAPYPGQPGNAPYPSQQGNAPYPNQQGAVPSAPPPV